MIGNLVQQQFVEGQNWPLGSALTMALMVLLLICMVAYLRQTARDARRPDETTTVATVGTAARRRKARA